jgi:membrane protein implicated in regulation of membrane protease activity
MTNEEFQQALAAAQNGDAEAMVVVAMAFLQGTDGMAANLDIGAYWMRRAANSDNANVREFMAVQFKELTSLAEKDDTVSLNILSTTYLQGIFTEADYEKAAFWAKKAKAAKGNVMSKLNAKGLLMFAEAFLPARNFRELMEGAQKGNANFQYGLGFAYLKGFGTDVNPEQAVFWFQKAVDQSHTGAFQTLSKVQNLLAIDPHSNFDQILPTIKSKGLAGLANKHPILWGIIVAAVISYLATFLNIGWLHSLAILCNIGSIISIAVWIVLIIPGIISGLTGRVKLYQTVSIALFILSIILTIGLSVHYIKGRKAENPVSIVLQNPFEAARKYVFGKTSIKSEPVEETPVIVTAMVISRTANIRSAPDSSKNNVITQVKNGGILTVTGPVEKGWFPVEINGKPGYVSADLVKIVEASVIVTATVISRTANIRSTPDSGKNNVITQVKNGGILTVTGPVEKGWLPVEVDGKPGYVSADLVRVNDQ